MLSSVRVCSRPLPSTHVEPFASIPLTRSLIANASSGEQFWLPVCSTGRYRRPDPLTVDLRVSFSPSMISTGLPSKRVGGSWVNGDSDRNRMAPVSRLGRVRSSAAAMIAPLEKPMAVGALAKL